MEKELIFIKFCETLSNMSFVSNGIAVWLRLRYDSFKPPGLEDEDNNNRDR